MKKHFVHFLSPGTFVSEETVKPIKSWDVDKAVAMAMTIVERYAARPYGFRFSTRTRTAKQLDSKESASSGIYYLGGRVLTLKQVKREMPDQEILIGNMERNNIAKVVVNDNSWRTVQELRSDSVVLRVKLPHPKDGAP